jgi:hypothetical protein
MNQPRFHIDTDVRLHAEVPLIAFLRLVHVGVAAVLAVLGRGRGGDDRSVYDAAFAKQQPFVGQMGFVAQME